MSAAAIAAGPPAQPPTFTHSAVVVRDGNPTLNVDGQPFFFYGAAFFYERIPADRWRTSMLALQTLGFNTLDLYIPWNWHELADGEFDFDGHSNARRDLRRVLALARELHFHLIVRPGPVIRNEWRNGGYPAWLLTRPAYGMPLHDVLEGRYPATATLQNANSDDAAAQWLANATHLRYATRWLQRALHEFDSVADLVVAVQLDDDQAAYIDNQTWPAPHLQTYLRTLESICRGVVGARLPVFINTYEMKVTAAAPVWPMGNWYQSDAYAIGEHDRAALEFSAGLLQTQTRYPVALSEFQAGWLAPPEDPAPRPADPTNTTLALHTLLGLGARGVIDFPAQDTRNPAGWEAPFANAAYAWDAALGVDLTPSPRYAPTQAFGALVAAHGSELASARRFADGAIAYLTSAYDETRLTNAEIFAIAARTQQTQQACRSRHLMCDLVDLRFIADAQLARYPFVVLPRDAGDRPFVASVRARLARYRVGGGAILTQPPAVVTPHAGGIADANVLVAADGAAFLDLVNFDSVAHTIPASSVALPLGRSWPIASLRVPARAAVLLYRPPAGRLAAAPIAPALSPAPSAARQITAGCAAVPASSTPPSSAPTTPGATGVQVGDLADDGFPRVALANGMVSVTVAPTAGARAFAFSPLLAGCPAFNFFTSVGALRDDVALQPPVSTTDRIGKYTRSFPAGTFNRTYQFATDPAAGSVRFSYAAPDVVPNGARIERTLQLEPQDSGFTVEQRTVFGAGPAADAQRAVRYDSFATAESTIIDERSEGAVGIFARAAGWVATVAWSPDRVESAELIPERTSTVLRLQFAAGPSITRYAIDRADTLDAARAMVRKERIAASAKP